MQEYVAQYLEQLQKFIDQGQGLLNSETHPSFKEMHRYIKLYWAGEECAKEFGGVPMEGRLKELADQALEGMNVTGRSFIKIYQTNNISCSAAYHMWFNPHLKLGPIEFMVFHECAHVKLGHFAATYLDGVTSLAESKQHEKEADLLAAQTLFDLGMTDIIVERIKQLKNAIDKNMQVVAGMEDHPSLEEMYAYMVEFAKSKGIAYETNN